MGMKLRKAWQRQSGAELLEFALVLPAFLLITAGIIDFGFVFQQYNVITNAAREGARLAVVPNTTIAGIDRRVKTYVTNAGLTRVPSTAVAAWQIPTHPGGPIYKGVRVTVTYPCQFFVLGPVSSLIGHAALAPTLRANAVMRYESQ